jgi:hypothetical protein
MAGYRGVVRRRFPVERVRQAPSPERGVAKGLAELRTFLRSPKTSPFEEGLSLADGVLCAVTGLTL